MKYKKAYKQKSSTSMGKYLKWYKQKRTARNWRKDMREYQTREDAENDSDLDLMIIWTCNKCGKEREASPGYNEGGKCECGGKWIQTGESYYCT